MSIGETIKKYRKDLGMSQDDLGQKLHVSRQTISLWEKDQTYPTTDNLIRLKEIFHISVDEILGLEVEEKKPENEAKETYLFEFTKSDVQNMGSYHIKKVLKKPVLVVIGCILLILNTKGVKGYQAEHWFYFGILGTTLLSIVKNIRVHTQVWKNSREIISRSIYEYNLFENYLELIIYRNHEIVRKLKVYYSEIEQIQLMGNWLFVQLRGQAYMLRKSDLKENSIIYSYMYQNSTKTARGNIPEKWKTISNILFAASLLSLFGALKLTEVVSNANGLFVENLWLFFLLTPIPLASVIFGFFLKRKGYLYKKNLITGIIMLIVLCFYGSFTFIF